MKYDVFISYSSDDQKIAEGVCRYLERNNYRCFVAYRDILPGRIWAEIITDALDESAMMVVVFSQSFNKSKQTDREIEIASENQIPILTYRVADEEMTGAKKFFLKNLNWIDAFPDPQKCFGQLLESVKKLIGGGAQEGPTPVPPDNLDVIKGVFSVSPTKKVRFSKGNLQYQASTNMWRFAERQRDYIGKANERNLLCRDWIDLFGFGTGKMPESVSVEKKDYQQIVDWGCNLVNSVVNNSWFTLSADEWKYVFNVRRTLSGKHYAKAQLAGVKGVLLLPDDWEMSKFLLKDCDQEEANYDNNIIKESQWLSLEKSGIVFLPAAGYRIGSDVSNAGLDGNYWSFTTYYSYGAHSLDFRDGFLKPRGNSYRYKGFSVRLVCLAVF